VRLEGDGQPHVLRAGAPRPGAEIRDCEPALVRQGEHQVITACADSASVRRSCFMGTDKGGFYFDRSGAAWSLTATDFSAKSSANAVDGAASMRGTSRGRQETLALRVTFHVGTSVAGVAVPNLWGKGEFGEPGSKW